MYFTIIDGLPYILGKPNDKDEITEMREVEVSAMYVRAGDLTHKLPKVYDILTETEVKAKLGIFKVDGWDKVNNKIVKTTNKVISSITPPEPSEDDELETEGELNEQEQTDELPNE